MDLSDDSGNTWTEANKPPTFENNDRSVNFIFWVTPGHSSEPDVWYAGTSPQGFFKSEDGGMTWNEVAGFANNELIKEIVNDNEGTPIGPRCIRCSFGRINTTGKNVKIRIQ